MNEQRQIGRGFSQMPPGSSAPGNFGVPRNRPPGAHGVPVPGARPIQGRGGHPMGSPFFNRNPNAVRGPQQPVDSDTAKLQAGMDNTISQDFTIKKEDLSILTARGEDSTNADLLMPGQEGFRPNPNSIASPGHPVAYSAQAIQPNRQVVGPDIINVEPARPHRKKKNGSDVIAWMTGKTRAQDSSDSDSDSEDDSVAPDKTAVHSLAEEIRQKLATIPSLDMTNDAPSDLLVEYLIKSVARLSLENSMLRAERGEDDQPAPQPQDSLNSPVNPDEQVPIISDIYYVTCSSMGNIYYSDVPAMPKPSRFATPHLRGRSEIEDIADYLDEHPNIAFTVTNRHVCPCGRTKVYAEFLDSGTSKLNHIALSDTLVDALNDVIRAHPPRFPEFGPNLSAHCYEPYLPFYWRNSEFLELSKFSHISVFAQKSIELLYNWLEERCRQDWNQADELIRRGKITERHYRKLFRPNELVVTTENDGKEKIYASKVKPYPWLDEQDCTVGFDYWSFAGVFTRQTRILSTLEIQMNDSVRVDRARKMDTEVDIASLTIHPIRFTKPGVLQRLVARGNKVWGCRRKKLISYNDPENWVGTPDKTVEHRFMVDYHMYKRMHPPAPGISPSSRDDLGPEAMNKQEPPDEDFLAMLPDEIHAFDFATKGWRLLNVDYITDVTWNKDAFKRLVLPAETKELIQAAVMAHNHQLGASLDIVANKGRGLLILLHGGPGTGKTLTAESIAEAQERPLYRVTCGDVGTDPGKVEKYLESVLTIGKAWNCVVLLDEADVFMEERTIADQTQNAIVSVFLRVLEYYDGILILTTNRVGTFDEAFKSRIHLALPYSKLDEDQRVEIWRNFIHILSKSKERVDIGDLESNVHKLAQFDLNGRQIRNVVTLSRYLAKFRKQMLVYKHVQDALASVVKFDEYLLQLRGSDDRWATESKIR